MAGRWVRDLFVEAVWAGALTALALGSAVIGLLLVAAGVLQLVAIHHGRSSLLFGAASKPSTTSSTGL